MALISLSGYSNPKKRPKAYKARDAAYSVGGKNGYYIAALPRPYPNTPQQNRVKAVAQECGITRGMKKADLQMKMKDCVGPKLRRK